MSFLPISVCVFLRSLTHSDQFYPHVLYCLSICLIDMHWTSVFLPVLIIANGFAGPRGELPGLHLVALGYVRWRVIPRLVGRCSWEYSYLRTQLLRSASSSRPPKLKLQSPSQMPPCTADPPDCRRVWWQGVGVFQSLGAFKSVIRSTTKWVVLCHFLILSFWLFQTAIYALFWVTKTVFWYLHIWRSCRHLKRYP